MNAECIRGERKDLHISLYVQTLGEEVGFIIVYNGPVEKWEGSDKNLRNWPKIKWPIYIVNH